MQTIHTKRTFAVYSPRKNMENTTLDILGMPKRSITNRQNGKIMKLGKVKWNLETAADSTGLDSSFAFIIRSNENEKQAEYS